MIKSFRHKGLEAFFRTGSTKGINAAHSNKLRRQLALLNNVTRPEEMNLPGWKLHPLKGQFKNFWAVSVNGNWRLTFMFDGNDAEVVDYQDYR